MSDILGLETFALGGQRTGYYNNNNGLFNTNYENMIYALSNYDPDILVLSGSLYDITGRYTK